MLIRFILGFCLGSITIFLFMLPSSFRHGWSPAFTVILLSGGILLGLLVMFISAQAWKELLSSWADYFK